jgi:hypothetical protein
VHTPTDNKNDNKEDTFYEEPEHVSDSSWTSNAKAGKDMYKLTIKNESVNEIINDNGVKKVKFTHQKMYQEYSVSISQHL